MDQVLSAIFDALTRSAWAILSFFSTAELVSVYNLAITIVIAAVVLLLRAPARRAKGYLMSRLFPAEVWQHPSALLDVKFFMVIQAMRAVVMVPVLAVLTAGLSYQVLAGLEAVAGPRWPGSTGPNTWLAIGLYTLFMFLAEDFGLFYSHYLQHKWRWLWSFHKVHHSARVLVPFTAMRFHPLDMFWNNCWAAAMATVMSGVCQYLFYNGEDVWRLMGNNLVVGVAYLTTHNLRHSHVWLHYPHKIANWLLSPAQHQIHHSLAPEHIDTNFGRIVAAWDRMFGTLVNPTKQLDLDVGVEDVPESGPLAHSTLKGLLLAPFRELRMLYGRKPEAHASHPAKPTIPHESV